MIKSSSLEVWGGLECTRVRIGNEVRDQIADTGHDSRPGDLDLIAALGIRTLRHSVLWETVCKVSGEQDWRWHDERFNRLRVLGVAPIAGLVHHGSGPSYCDILDPAFPQSLASFAGDVARRYPWIEQFTPVNEPMTTARLCGLYGHWHPHGRDEATCFRVVVAECKAIAAAMKAIRLVTPTAALIQTEDIGRIFATPPLQHQADYENDRRWLALDLLAGSVDRDHPFYRRLLDHGIDDRHLAELADEPCPPDVIGIDHYLTSDRFLDDRVELHPREAIGGNDRQRYVDLAAARADVPEDETGFLPRLREAWKRYGLPLAITEVHNGCTRDEQLRWLMEGWGAGSAARREGIDLRAVSVWSLFGAADWNSVLTRREGFYESGAFDIRFHPPRRTVIASAIRALAGSGEFEHPVLARPGWWRADASLACPSPLMLAGSQSMVTLVANCCAARRLDFQDARAAPGEPACDPRVQIHAESGFEAARQRDRKPQPLTLTCVFPASDGDDRPSLIVEARHSFDPTHVVDAFLDLVIDGTLGHFRVIKAGPDRQYSFEPADRRPMKNVTHWEVARSA